MELQLVCRGEQHLPAVLQCSCVCCACLAHAGMGLDVVQVHGIVLCWCLSTLLHLLVSARCHASAVLFGLGLHTVGAVGGVAWWPACIVLQLLFAHPQSTGWCGSTWRACCADWSGRHKHSTFDIVWLVLLCIFAAQLAVPWWMDGGACVLVLGRGMSPEATAGADSCWPLGLLLWHSSNAIVCAGSFD